HLDRLNEGVPERLHLLAKLWIEMTEQHAEHDRGQHLEIEALKERPVVGGQFSCCGLGCHRRLSLSFLTTFPVPEQGFHGIISLTNANGGIAVLHPIHGPPIGRTLPSVQMRRPTPQAYSVQYPITMSDDFARCPSRAHRSLLG